MLEEHTPTPSSGRQRVVLLPWLGVLFAGMAALAMWFLLRPILAPIPGQGYYRPPPYAFTYGFNHPILLEFIPFFLALLAWRRGARVALVWLIGGAVVLHAMLLFASPPQSQDIHQYLFYGRMQAHYHLNPYLSVPTQIPNLLQDQWYSWVRWPNQTTVYGPVWTLLTFGVAKLAGDSHTTALFLMKLVIFALDLAVMALIVRATRDRGEEGAAGFGILAYAWNPLILITVPLGGLNDVALAAAMLGALVARRRGHAWVTTVLLTLATLVKVYAGIALLLHLVLLARERGWRRTVPHAAVAGGLAVVTFAPYWGGFGTVTGLLHIAGLSNHALAGVLQRVITPVLRAVGVGTPYDLAGQLVRWVGVAFLLWAVVWAIRKVRTEGELWPAVLTVLIIYILITPWFLYWYLVTPIALVAVLPWSRLTAPVLLGSGTALITAAFPPWLLGQVVEATCRYAPPIGLYLSRRLQAKLAALPAPAAEAHDREGGAGGGGMGAIRRPPVPLPRDAAAAK